MKYLKWLNGLFSKKQKVESTTNLKPFHGVIMNHPFPLVDNLDDLSDCIHMIKPVGEVNRPCVAMPSKQEFKPSGVWVKVWDEHPQGNKVGTAKV